MGTWWIADKDKKTGPFGLDELKRLLENGKISTSSMVWKEGMEIWQPLDEVAELSSLKSALPPPIPKQPDPDPLSYPMATRWPRFFARTFDLWWEVLLIAAVVGAILGRYSPAYLEWIDRPASGQLFGLICLPFAMILDAAVYRIFGNSPGKAMLKLRVGTIRGETLTFTQYVRRNFSIWSSGLAFGIPLINLFTLNSQYKRIGKGQQTSYDESTGNRVRAGKSGLVAKAIFGIAFACLFGVMAALNAQNRETEFQAIKVREMPNYSWANPITQISASINSKWKHSTQTNSDGQNVYTFSELTGHAVVVLAVEQAPGFSMDDYVRAFKKGTSSYIQFVNGGQFFENGGLEQWKGSGTMVADSSSHVNVHVVQSGSKFWRVVAIQSMPYEYSDALVAELSATLWKTIN